MYCGKALISTFLVIILSSITSCSRVLELSDRFLDVKSEGLWFVKFYAPYCGYCKKLEPVWGHVAQALFNTNIRVGKVDCTRFKNACQKLKITGYPTIIFFRGNNEHTYNGERSKDELVHFAARMSGPPVQQVTRVESFDVLKSSNPVFFVYIGKQSGSIWNNYYAVSEANQAHGYFYSTSDEVASKHFFIDRTPSILVYKESSHYIFPLPDNLEFMETLDVNSSLHTWVCQEKFLTFPRVTRENLHQLRQTRKYLVLAVVEENKLNEMPTHELEFRDMVEQIIRNKRNKYHDEFQFGWVGNPELSHTIAMEMINTPHLIVLDTKNHHHYIPDDEPLQLTPEAIEIFLETVRNQSSPALGGDSFLVRCRRGWFEFKKLLGDMWKGNPVLSMVIFGLPLGFLSLICYSIFCADILDADEANEETHEKKE